MKNSRLIGLLLLYCVCTSCAVANNSNSINQKSLPPTSFQVIGVMSLNSDLNVDVDNFYFRSKSILQTNGYRVSITVNKSLIIDDIAIIQGLSRSKAAECSNDRPPTPAPSADAASFDRGPRGSNPAPEGNKGTDGNRGNRGILTSSIIPKCVPRKIDDVSIVVLGDAAGSLSVQLGGAQGAPGAAGQSGGRGGNGQQGGTCITGETLCGWYGGFGGDGGSGTKPPANLSVSGSGGNFSITVNGDSEEFQITTIDTWAGQIGGPGYVGEGGKPGLGGFFGLGKEACEGLGTHKGMCMFPGAPGMTAIAEQESFGRIGNKGRKSVTPTSMEREICDGTTDTPTAPAEYVDFWKFFSSQMWGYIPPTRYSSIDGLPYIFIDSNGGRDKLFPIPPIASSAPNWKPYLPIEPASETIFKYYSQCLSSGQDICPALAQPNCSAWNCCLAPKGAADSLPRAYPSCLKALITPTAFDQKSNNVSEPLGNIKLLSLLPRIIYRELAGLVRVASKSELATDKILGGAAYIKVSDTFIVQGTNKIPATAYISLTPELFERISGAITKSLPQTLKSLSISNLMESPIGEITPVEFGFACNKGKSIPFVKPIYEPLMDGVGSSIEISSGKYFTAYGPPYDFNQNKVSIGITSFREWTWILPSLDEKIKDSNASEMCSFIQDVRRRNDSFADCGSEGPQMQALYAFSSASRNRDLRAIFGNILFTRAFSNFITQNVPTINFGPPCSLPIGVPDRVDSFPMADTAKNLLGNYCRLPTH